MDGEARLGSGDADALRSDGHIGGVRWTVAAMLFAAFTINYFDRQILSVLKPTLMKSVGQGGIGLTEVGYGYITAAFQFSYGIGFLIAGRFIDRVGTPIGYVVMMALWSLASVGHALASSVIQFTAVRVMLGLGEAGNQPAGIKTVAEWFPQRERALAAGIFNCGANVGAIIAPLAVPFLALHYGWASSFVMTGVLGGLWLIVWTRCYRAPAAHPGVSEAERVYIGAERGEKLAPRLSWFSLLTYRQTWAFAIAKGVTDPIFGFYLFWLPDFFGKRYGVDKIAVPLMVVYTASMFGSLLGGWLSVPLLRMGLTQSKARLTAMMACALVVCPVFMVTHTRSEGVAIALLCIAAAAHQGWGANILSTVSDMFPRSEVASVAGIGGAFSSACGTLFAIFTGYLLKRDANDFSVIFVIASVIYVLALLVLVFASDKLRKVDISA